MMTADDFGPAVLTYVKGRPGTKDVYYDESHLTVSFSTERIKELSERYGPKDLLIWKIEFGSRYLHIKRPCFTLYYTQSCPRESREQLRKEFLRYGIKSATRNIDSKYAYVFSRYIADSDVLNDFTAKKMLDNIKELMDKVSEIDGYIGEIISINVPSVRRGASAPPVPKAPVRTAPLTLSTEVSFADVTPGYWDSYHMKVDDPSIPLADIELKSRVLRMYQRQLYDGRTYISKDGTEHTFTLDDDLCCEGVRYGSDSITVSYRFYSKCSDLIDKARKEVEYFDEDIESFIRSTYTIGGEIIFPAQRNSVNQARGCHPKIADRFDLTLKAIKRWYDNEDPETYDLGYTLNLAPQKRFFSMFRDFREYCRFFFLEDMIDENDDVILFCDSGEDPIPKDMDTYLELIRYQLLFVKKRNERIEEYVRSR